MHSVNGKDTDMRRWILTAAALLPAVALAESDVALTGKAGTLGFGLELTTRVGLTTNLRFGAGAYNWYADTRESGVDYDARWQTRTASAIGDIFPIPGSIFRLSAGLFYNDNRLDMTAEPDSGNTYELNGTRYTAAQIGTLKGRLTFNKTAPYLGVGWGSPFAKSGGWGFMLDVGAMYQGKPKLSLTSDSALCASSAACQADLAAEQRDAERDLRSYRWYPVVNAGAVYRF